MSNTLTAAGIEQLAATIAYGIADGLARVADARVEQIKVRGMAGEDSFYVPASDVTPVVRFAARRMLERVSEDLEIRMPPLCFVRLLTKPEAGLMILRGQKSQVTRWPSRVNGWAANIPPSVTIVAPETNWLPDVGRTLAQGEACARGDQHLHARRTLEQQIDPGRGGPFSLMQQIFKPIQHQQQLAPRKQV